MLLRLVFLTNTTWRVDSVINNQTTNQGQLILICPTATQPLHNKLVQINRL